MIKTEDFKEVSSNIKWTSYVIGAVAIAVLIYGIVQFSDFHNSLSQFTSDLIAGRLAMDKVGSLLSVLSMQLSLVFGTIASSGVLAGSAIALYAEWRSINLKAYSEYLICHAVEDIKEEIRSNRLNLDNSTTRQDKLPK